MPRQSSVLWNDQLGTLQTLEGEHKCNPLIIITTAEIQSSIASHWISGSRAQDCGGVTIMPVTGELKTRAYEGVLPQI